MMIVICKARNPNLYGRFPMLRALGLLLSLAPLVAARWCQVENVKADVHGNYSFSGPWKIDSCTTLSLDHGMCVEADCPWRVPFSDEDVIELADKLHGNSALTALSIASNKMTDESTIAIAEALRENEALSDLNLQANEIGDAGAVALADALATNEIFLTLNLEHNKLTDEGARALLAVLRSNSSAFEKLYIGHNSGVSEALVAEVEMQNKLAFMPPGEREMLNLPDEL